MFRIEFPSLASPCVELVCIHATYKYDTRHAGCEALSAVSSYTDAFVSGFNTFMHATGVFILSHRRVFSPHDFVKLSSFRNSYPGSHSTNSSPFPTTVLAFILVAKKKSELGFLPWRSLSSNWCAFMQPTSMIGSTQAARRFQRSVRTLMLLFQALISTRTNTYVIFLITCLLWCI